MKSFIKLFNFELNRFVKMFVTLLVIVFVVQLASVIMQATSYMVLVKDVTKGGRVSPEQFLDEYWPYSLIESVYSIGFIAPIALGVVGLLFYMFFIWYRDWFARNTFIYRLLMLPTSRMNIYFAKLATIMVTVLGMVAFQLIYLVIYKQVIKWIVPLVYRMDLQTGFIVEGSEYLNIIIPSYVSSFFIAYGLGITFVIVVFTAILFERSFRLIGAIIGVTYIGFAFVIFALPYLVQFILFDSFYLYADEMFYLQAVITLVIAGVSLWISRYLLTEKVTV